MVDERVRKQSVRALALGAIGVVYGDIGTSPLYTIHEIFAGSGGVDLNHDNLIGVVSVIVWTLMIVVSLKYVTLILRADNHGEGGIMALLALASSAVGDNARLRRLLFIAGVFGAALFYGDGVITPAISVLSAVEGLEVAAPPLKAFVVPLTVAVLVVLFGVQRKGTAGIGFVFGPIMFIWFTILAVAGVVNISSAPRVLVALNPLFGAKFMLAHGWGAFVALGAIVLAVTGAEALYADMGHFGRLPIRTAWFGLVFPALAINYLGQGALLMAEPRAIENPFYRLFPGWQLLPAVGLATLATVIASQAVISGAYSMTKQAVQLGFLPRMQVVHTSAGEIGQIYLPSINWILLISVVAAVVGFGSSTKLASAYGIAVTGTMLITTVLTFWVIRYGWGYNWLLCILATGFFLLIDLAFFSANTLKIAEGGWFPLVIGAGVFAVMVTWKRGREILLEKLRSQAIPLEPFMKSVAGEEITRVPRTAVFLMASPEGVPRALLHNLLHNNVLHERVVFLTVVYEEVPYVPLPGRVLVENLGNAFYRLRIFYGFMDQPDIPAALERCDCEGFELDMAATSFFVSRETVVPTESGDMAHWREELFATMSDLASSVVDYFKIPPNRVIELGTRVEI